MGGSTVQHSHDLIRDGFFATGDVYAALERRTEHVEAIVTGAWRNYLAPVFPDGVAVVAVGGYGRRELFPHSDIDVLILISGPSPAGVAKEALSRFLQSIWDANLRLSHSVHSVKECCELHETNIELNVSLLDQRFLAGDHDLHADLAARLPKFLQAQRQPLSRHLCRLARQRHVKFHDTIYHLEPNIKETPGGMRDLHLLRWLHQLAGGGPAERLDQIEPARRFLSAVRCWLHYRAGRDNNLLTFDAQEEIAGQRFLSGADAAGIMRAYYRRARLVYRAAIQEMEAVEGQGSSLLAGFRDWRTRLSNAEFTVSRERVLFKAPQRLEKDPEMVLRLFQLVGRHKLGIHRESERRIQEYLPSMSRWFAGPRDLWTPLRQLLALPHASLALRSMHETGVLRAIFPEWETIECYVVRDFHHRYTVDEHTLIAIENLEELPSADAQRARFAGLLSELDDPALLKLALLFHDVGKGGDAGGHCDESARLADAAAVRIGVPESSRQLLRFLIEHHLDLSAAMNGRDLDDPNTALWLASRIPSVEALKYLAVLTCCDIAAVNPTALSPWRVEQLWRVYLIAHRELTRELDTERIAAAAGGPPERLAFLKGFPTRYLRVHTEAEVDRHLALDERRAQAGVAIEIDKTAGAYELTVLAKDRLFLFASIAGALASFGMNILKAEAFANQQGTVLDTFTFADPQRTLELNPQEMDRLRLTLERVVLGRLDVKSLLKQRPKTAPPSKGSRIEGTVAFDNTASGAATLVEVVAQDRPGLLYDLTAAFSEGGCSIDVVLVDTEAHKAIDVFYVTIGGHKIDGAAEQKLRVSLLKACAA